MHCCKLCREWCKLLRMRVRRASLLLLLLLRLLLHTGCELLRAVLVLRRGVR